MAQIATVVHVTDEERDELERWLRTAKTEQRLAFRARVVLAAGAGEGSTSIARREGVRTTTVSTWRTRFAAKGLPGLQDEPRRGRPREYGAAAEQRILAKLDEAPPEGYGSWHGSLLATALDIPAHQVWNMLRKHGIQLQRRRSWCISSDPDFAPKAAEIVALYLNPPENAVVLSVDEKPHIQALERAQGYLRLPNGKAVRGVNHEYKRHGTTTLFAALNVLTGTVRGMHTERRRREEFLTFMNAVVADYPGQEIHVVLDNLSTHKPKHDVWLARHPNVHFHFTPTHASWLNQIEVWFSILSRQALKHSSFRSPGAVRDRIDAFIQTYNHHATPFRWRAADVHPSRPQPIDRELTQVSTSRVPLAGDDRTWLPYPNPTATSSWERTSLTTTMADGSLQSTPVWIDLEGDVLSFNTAEGRVKTRNLDRDGHVALSVMDAANPYRYIQIRGRVTGKTNEGADAHIDKLAKKYLGADSYPGRNPAETRVIYNITPEHVQTMG